MTTLDCRNRPAPPWLVAVATALGVFVGAMQCSAGCGVDDPCEKAHAGAMRALLPAVALAGCFAPTGSETDAIQVTTGTSAETSGSSSTGMLPTTGVDATTTTTSGSSSSGTTADAVTTSVATTGEVPTTSASSTTPDDTSATTTDGPVCFHYHGPSHDFLGLTSTVFVTGPGSCSPSGGDMDYDAAFFCRGFYGPSCIPVPGYKPGEAQADDAKMHRGNSCYLTLEYIPGTLCSPNLGQGCTITDLWDSVVAGITDLACACPCDEDGWGEEGWSTT